MASIHETRTDIRLNIIRLTRRDVSVRMKIPKEEIAEFKRLYKIEYGKEITDEKACELLTNLVLLLKQIYRPTPEQTEERDEAQ